MALFQDYSKVNRIIAANSGWYTLPSEEFLFPYGIQDTYVIDDDLIAAFAKELIIMVGEEDNHDETRGHLRVTDEANAQGAHRLERAEFFIETSRQIATDIQTDFNWRIQIVSRVGHDYKLMSLAAAELLYGEEDI